MKIYVIPNKKHKFQGLKYIHESVIESHGYLKSSNCIINNQFALKISDFSKTIFMSDMERLSRATEEAMNERKLLNLYITCGPYLKFVT